MTPAAAASLVGIIGIFNGGGHIAWSTILSLIHISWAAMAVGFATALGAAVPALSGDFAKDVISFILIVGLTIVNIFGVNVSKFVNNLITISKLVPLALFIAIGIFFINGANFTPRCV